jgi:hypothetical protein
MADGTVTWTFVGAGGWSALLNEPAVRDFQRLGSFFQLRRWCDLLPSGLYGMQTLVVDGTGAYARWSDGNGENGGMDWVIAAAESDGSALVAYVPDAHTGSFTVAMSAMRGASRARWYDPSEGTYVPDSSGAGYVLPNSQPHTFTVPGPNSEGASDWVLVLEAEHTGQP